MVYIDCDVSQAGVHHSHGSSDVIVDDCHVVGHVKRDVDGTVHIVEDDGGVGWDAACLQGAVQGNNV